MKTCKIKLCDNQCLARSLWATRLEQANNRRKQIPGKSGHTGVYWHKYSKKWIVIFIYNKKRMHLGAFADIKDAIKTRKQAEIELR